MRLWCGLMCRLLILLDCRGVVVSFVLLGMLRCLKWELLLIWCLCCRCAVLKLWVLRSFGECLGLVLLDPCIGGLMCGCLNLVLSRWLVFT